MVDLPRGVQLPISPALLDEWVEYETSRLTATVPQVLGDGSAVDPNKGNVYTNSATVTTANTAGGERWYVDSVTVAIKTIPGLWYYQTAPSTTVGAGLTGNYALLIGYAGLGPTDILAGIPMEQLTKSSTVVVSQGEVSTGPAGTTSSNVPSVLSYLYSPAQPLLLNSGQALAANFTNAATASSAPEYAGRLSISLAAQVRKQRRRDPYDLANPARQS